MIGNTSKPERPEFEWSKNVSHDDGSWGTRQFKWTYWGSRTCDGCQPGFAMLAKEHPAFATAVLENTRLYRRCTARGLLQVGPHCIIRGVKPCVHHTFTHGVP